MSDEKTIHERLTGLEGMFETILAMLSKAAPVIDMITGAAPIVNGALAIGNVADDVMRAVEGVDPAALAASRVTVSTGNDALDSRLLAIETFLESAFPLLKYLAKEFGMSAPQEYAAPASVYANAQAARIDNVITQAG